MRTTFEALTLEGDTRQVLTALVEEKPVHYVHGGGGMGGAAAVALAPALEALDLRKSIPTTGAAISVGVINQLLIAYRLGQQLSACYCNDFCTDRFIKPGLRPWFDGSKLNLAYYEAVLAEKLKTSQAHPDSEIRVGVTNWESGEYCELTADLADTKRVAKLATASAWLPCLGKGYKTVDGVPFTDGGVAKQLPLPPNPKPTDPPLLVVLAAGESVSRAQRVIERQIFKRAPVHIAELVFGRSQQFQDQKAYLRSQLELPIGHLDRALPPTCMIEPVNVLSVVEQRMSKVQEALGETYLSMYKLLREHLFQKAA